MTKNILFTLAAALALALSPSEAMAYIDPGSGSAIMSVIIGFLVASGLLVKTFWYKITSVFRRKPSVEGKE